MSTNLGTKATRFTVDGNIGEVSALLMRPDGARRLLVFGHGAHVPMRHEFMEGVAGRLAEHGIATFRYQFPYMEHGGKIPDREPVLIATVRAAVSKARELAEGLPLLAGGKSLGARMTSRAASEEPLPGVRGLVFFGFPLHPAGKPATGRSDHLNGLTVPMLFLQGTRDPLAELDLLKPLVKKLGARAELHLVEGGDHSFHVPKGSGKTDDEVIEELAHVTAEWGERIEA